MLGMTLGIALSGAITFLLLGVIEWFGLIHGLNSYLIAGVITFIFTTLLVLRFFRNPVKVMKSKQDINDY